MKELTYKYYSQYAVGIRQDSVVLYSNHPTLKKPTLKETYCIKEKWTGEPINRIRVAEDGTNVSL